MNWPGAGARAFTLTARDSGRKGAADEDVRAPFGTYVPGRSDGNRRLPTGRAASSSLCPALAVLVSLLLLPAVSRADEVRLGSEVLAQGGFQELRGKRVGLLTNPTGVNRRGESTIDLLRHAPGVKLAALFAPEHGLHGTFGAGQEFTNTVDRRTGLPVYSLYGPGRVRMPTPSMLRGLDALVYDLQDTGVRSYTYITTMGLAMEACGGAGCRFVVLDRPNPLGGLRVEGPMLDPKFQSFVGRWPIPYVYGLTCGELARMINGEGWNPKPCRLAVIPMKGWRRVFTWADTQLAWVPTSPNVQRADTVPYLVATGLLGEIGGMSIGMGTDSPFRYLAAPWLKKDAMAGFMNERGLPGVQFEPVRFAPRRGLFKDQAIEGVRIRITDPARAPLVTINFHALEAARKLAGKDLFTEATRRGKSFEMFDKVNGTDATRKALSSGKSARVISDSWRRGEETFRQKRGKYLLYP